MWCLPQSRSHQDHVHCRKQTFWDCHSGKEDRKRWMYNTLFIVLCIGKSKTLPILYSHVQQNSKFSLPIEHCGRNYSGLQQPYAPWTVNQTISTVRSYCASNLTLGVVLETKIQHSTLPHAVSASWPHPSSYITSTALSPMVHSLGKWVQCERSHISRFSVCYIHITATLYQRTDLLLALTCNIHCIYMYRDLWVFSLTLVCCNSALSVVHMYMESAIYGNNYILIA